MQTTKDNTAKFFEECEVPLLLPARVRKQILVGLLLGSFWNPPIVSPILQWSFCRGIVFINFSLLGAGEMPQCTVTPDGKMLHGQHGLGRCTRTGGEEFYRYLLKFLAEFKLYSASKISSSIQIAFNSLDSLDAWMFGWVRDEFLGSSLYLGTSFDQNVIVQNASRRETFLTHTHTSTIPTSQTAVYLVCNSAHLN